MKWSFLLIAVILFSAISTIAGESNSSLELSRKAYHEKNFDQAISLLRKEIKSDKRNPSLYFNLGLAYRAEKKFSHAIWAFEKTLKLKPNDSEAIQLIEACYTELGSDRTWTSETGTFKRSLFSLGSNFWSLMTIAFSIATSLFIIRVRRSKKVSRKKIQLGMMISSSVLLLFSLYIAASANDFEKDSSYAIVVEEDVPAFSSESLSVQDTAKVRLQPGTKVKILKWNRVGRKSIQTPEGQKVFIERGIERI